MHRLRLFLRCTSIHVKIKEASVTIVCRRATILCRLSLFDWHIHITTIAVISLPILAAWILSLEALEAYASLLLHVGVSAC